MPYSNIPGVKAAYIDKGALSVSQRSTQPNILVVGPAESGASLERFNVVEVSAAEAEFGSSTPLLRLVHEAIAQGSDNISVLRSGGYKGRLRVTDSASGVLTVLPESHDDEVLSRYALQITTQDDGSNRYVVYDLVDRAYVFDTLGALVLDDGTVAVVDSGFAEGVQLNETETNPRLWISLADVVTGDFDVSGASVTISSATVSHGSDGLSESLVEKYASLAAAYFHLDYKDADYLIPADVHVDERTVANEVADTLTSGTKTASGASDYGYYWAGPPEAGTAKDVLGYMWQFVYRGKIYVGFSDTTDYFSATGEAAASNTVSGVTLTCSKVGKGGNANTLAFVTGGTAGAETVDITWNGDTGGYDIVVHVETTVSTQTQVKTALDAAIAAATQSSVGAPSARTLLPSALFSAASVASGSTAVTAAAATHFTSGVGGAFVLLTDPRESVPTGVSDQLAAGTDAQLREANFAHQLAEACYLASTNWKTMQGVISFKGPEAYDRETVSNWVGQLPSYSNNGEDEYIDSSADDGFGILGNKFLAGAWGYRGGALVLADSTDGIAYGGFIRTVGASLPNGEQWPYGVDSDDEAVDESGRVIDLGKHIYVTYDYPLHSNAFNGGSTYRSSIVSTVAAKLAVTPASEEPIGLNGRVSKITSPPRIHSTQLSQLAGIRAIGLRQEDGVGLILTSAKTAAHPSSDYTRSSTVRAVNRLISGVRDIAKKYVGKPFNPQSLMSLKSAVDQLLVVERQAGVHNGAKARYSYSRADRILGRLTIQLAIVPPFSIDTIVVKTSLAADESEL